jgi:DNA repair exonuclease SbcCD ATPase subunit
MRLRRVKLHGFGQFNRGLDVVFAPDRLNVVVGRNEAGKSTLLNAIGGVLFGFRDLNMVRKYEPWEEHDRYAGEVSLGLDDGRRVRVERDFRAGTARIVEETDDGERTLFSGSADPRGTKAEDALYFDVLGELLGFQDESVFRNTAFVGQSGLKAEVSEQIRRLLSGAGDADYKGALHELHSRRAELTADNPWRTKAPGRRRALEEARDAVESAERGLRAEDERLRRSAACEDELAALDARRPRDEEARAAARSRVDGLAAAVGLAEKRASAAVRREETGRRAEQARKLKETVEDRGEKVRRDYAAHRRVGDDFLDTLAALGGEREELAREEEALAAAVARRDAVVRTPNGKLGAGLGGGLFAGAAAVGALTGVGAAVGAIAGAALGAFGWALGRNLGTGYAENRRVAEEAARAAERALQERRRRIADLEPKTGSLLVGRDAAAVAEEHRAYRALLEEGKRAHAALKALGDPAEIEAAHAESVATEARAEAAWAELRARHPEIPARAETAALNAELARARRAAADADADAERARARGEELRLELAKLSASPDGDVARLADLARRERERVKDLDLEKDALKEAIDLLDDCLREFRENDVFRLSEDMSRLFAKLTGDKYVRVQLGPSLEPTVSTPDRSGIGPEDLSQGAHDQLYFAMRVAVVRHLARREAPPVFLDDPFVNFDAERLRAARGILGGMSEHQCVLVTCDRQYEQWTDAVVDLDRARDATATAGSED